MWGYAEGGDGGWKGGGANCGGSRSYRQSGLTGLKMGVRQEKSGKFQKM